MKKELALHFLVAIALFIPIFLLRYFNFQVPIASLSNWPLLVGIIIGTILPDIDHIIYVYYLRPYEATSQRVMYEVQKGKLMESWNILSSTRSERRNLTFHNMVFQIVFLVLSFLVVSSSSSLLGRGLVVAFLLHLLVDEILDFKETGNLSNWFDNIPIILDSMQLKIYLGTNFIIILLFGFVF